MKSCFGVGNDCAFTSRMENENVRYAHTFLFACPNCNFPIATSRIANQKNLEPLEGETFKIRCAHCGAVSNISGLLSKMHFVTLGHALTEKKIFKSLFPHAHCESPLRNVGEEVQLGYDLSTRSVRRANGRRSPPHVPR